MSGMQEYDSEPVPGLPQELPAGEQMIWQGSPTFWGMAKQVLWLPYIAMYFATLMVWNIVSVLRAGGGMTGVLTANLWLAPVALAGLCILGGIAWAMHRSTMYTITNRRVVIRFGLALPMAVNIPFQKIRSASLSLQADGSGNIPLVLSPDHRMFYAMMWPNVRPWAMTRPEPMLRAIPDAALVADKLGRALAAHSAMTAELPAQARATRRPVRTARQPVRAGGAIPGSIAAT
jgi:Bacterial PH domain